MRALFFGTYDADAHPRTAILRQGLQAHGVDVLECNVPLGLSTAARVSMLRHPWLLPRLVVRLATCWARLVRRSRRLPRVDVVVVGYLGHFDVLLARRLFRATPVALDHLIGAGDTAADRGLRRGVRQRLLRALDAAALRAADLVLVDTEEHREILPPSHGRKAAVIAVGAPAAWLTARAAPEPADVARRPVRVVFFGLYTPLQGAPVIGRALAALAGEELEVTMVGSGQDLERTRRLAAPNTHVTWHDWVSPAELPSLVSTHDVCLGIFGTSDKARRVVPNKVFQGAAAGCALLTSDTPPQRRVLGDAARYVPPGDADALAAALRELAHDRSGLAHLRSAARRLALDAFTPAAVTAPLVGHLQTLVARTASSSTPAVRGARPQDDRRTT